MVLSKTLKVKRIQSRQKNMKMKSKTKNIKNKLKYLMILKKLNKTILMLLKNNLKFSKRKIFCWRKGSYRATKSISLMTHLNFRNASQNSIKIKNCLFKKMKIKIN